jgi:hypothetical protein
MAKSKTGKRSPDPTIELTFRKSRGVVFEFIPQQTLSFPPANYMFLKAFSIGRCTFRPTSCLARKPYPANRSFVKSGT